jgi:hypothetical protein
MASAEVALQSFGHQKTQDPPSHPEGGTPSPFYFAVNCYSGILPNDVYTQTNHRSFERATLYDYVGSVKRHG